MTNEHKIVAVTGQNGYVAVWVSLAFLQKGCKVRGSVRTEAKAQAVRQNFNVKPWVDKGLLEVVVVPDLGSEKGLAYLLQGVDAVRSSAGKAPHADIELARSHCHAAGCYVSPARSAVDRAHAAGIRLLPQTARRR